jgi:hypothetical protein
LEEFEMRNDFEVGLLVDGTKSQSVEFFAKQDAGEIPNSETEVEKNPWHLTLGKNGVKTMVGSCMVPSVVRPRSSKSTSDFLTVHYYLDQNFPS